MISTLTNLKLLAKNNFKNKTTVLVGGTFDLIHPNHIEFLEKSKKFGDILIVGVTSDKNVRERKGHTRPILKQGYRAKIVASLKPVDYVFISRKSAYSKKVLDLIKPDIVVFGLEGSTKLHRKKYNKKIEKSFPDMKVKFVNTNGEFSTTKIIKRLVEKS